MRSTLCSGWRGILVLVLVVALLLGCRSAAMPATIYADGSRGCKQQEGPVDLWSAPGGAPDGAHVVGQVPHGRELAILETASRYGVDYYLVEYDGQRGWLPINFSETIPPVCE